MQGDATPSQISYISKLASERKQALEPMPDWLKPPKTKWEASQLIKRLMSVPRDPRDPVVDPAEGFYTSTDNSYILVYKTRNGHIATKHWNGKSWEYAGRAGLRLVDKPMTGEEAAALGRAISGTGKGMCVVCLAEGRDPTLTDDRSIAVGYGQICANRYGWYYPTKEEAANLLAV